METVYALIGILLGISVVTLMLLIVLPIMGTYGWFVNKPVGMVRSGFHIFTRISPGQIKIIERGEKPVRMITNTPGKVFARVGSRDGPDYWELRKSSGRAEHPIADVWWGVRWWAYLVYNMTGLVFTGIYPFQKVREYELEKTTIRRKERDDAMRNESNLRLDVKTDISDHYRTRQFIFPIHVTKAETKDKIPLDIIGNAELETTNAFKAAYGTDRWDHAMTNLTTDSIGNKTKTLGLDDALSAKDADGARAISDVVESIKDDEIVCGINIVKFRILEINPALNQEDLSAIQAEAIANQKAKATRVDGAARADVLRDINKANADGGAYSIATMENESFVRAAEAVGKAGGTAFLTPGGNRSSIDSTQAAILAELQKLNKGKVN